MKYFLAYDEKLNKQKMARCCPGAIALGIIYLKGYQLTFCRHSAIIEEPGSTVPVAVWQIDDENEKYLDRYEGYPFYYTKKILNLKFKGNDIEAIVYITNKEHANFRLPECNYLDIVTRDYISSNLPIEKISEALHYTKNAIENKKVFYWFSPEDDK